MSVHPLFLLLTSYSIPHSLCRLPSHQLTGKFKMRLGISLVARLTLKALVADSVATAKNDRKFHIQIGK